MSRVPRLIYALAILMVLLAGMATASAKQAKPDGAVNVTVKYNGKGTVDANHRLWVWLFTSPDIGSQSIPIAEMSIEKNGGTASFPSVAATEVYIAVAYDEAGGFGGSAPPPPGSPIAMYGVKTSDTPPQAVTPGPKGAVTITFDDAQRMQ